MVAAVAMAPSAIDPCISDTLKCTAVLATVAVASTAAVIIAPTESTGTELASDERVDGAITIVV